MLYKIFCIPHIVNVASSGWIPTPTVPNVMCGFKQDQSKLSLFYRHMKVPKKTGLKQCLFDRQNVNNLPSFSPPFESHLPGGTLLHPADERLGQGGGASPPPLHPQPLPCIPPCPGWSFLPCHITSIFWKPRQRPFFLSCSKWAAELWNTGNCHHTRNSRRS